MATIFLKVPVDFDVSSIKTGRRDVAEIKKEFQDIQSSLKPGEKYRIAGVELDSSEAGFVDIKEGIKVVDALSKSQRKLNKDIDAATKTQKGSLTAIRQEIAVRQQQLNGLNKLADKEGYEALENSIKELKAEALEAQGVTRGSTRYLQEQLATLKANTNATYQTAESYEAYRTQVSNLSEGLRRQQGIQQGSKADLEAIKSELIQGRNAINRFTDPKKFRELSVQIGAVEDRLDAFQTTGQRLRKLVDGIGRIQVAFNAVGQVIQTVNQVINTFVNRTKQVESFNLALRNVGLGLDEVNRSFNQAYTTATALGAPLQSVEKSYKRMIPSLIGIGASADESDRFIEALSARTQTLGLNTEQSGRLMEAFAQVLSKGKLQGEELNQQISELDGAFRQQFAQAIGIATDELSELVETGGVSSATFVKGILKMQNGVEALKDNVENGNETIQQLQNQINNIKTKNIESLARSFDPLFRAILKAQAAYEKFIKDLGESDIVRNLTLAVIELAKGVGVVAAAFGLVVQAIATVLGPLLNILKAIDDSILVFRLAANAIGFLVGGLVALLIVSKLPGLFSSLAAEVIKLGIACLGATAKTLGLTAALGLLRKGQYLRALGAIGTGVRRFTKQVTAQTKATIKANGGLKKMGGSMLKTAGQGAILAAALAVTAYNINLIVTGINAYKEGMQGAAKAAELAAIAQEKFNKAQGKQPEPQKQGLFSGIAERAGRFFQNYNQGYIQAQKSFEGFLDKIEETNVRVATATANLAKQGTQLRANSDLTALNNKQLTDSIANQLAAAAAIRESVKAIDQQIAKTEINNQEDQERVNLLKQQKQTQEAELGQIEQTVNALQKESEARGLNVREALSFADALSLLQQENAKLLSQQKDLNLNAEAESYKKLADGVYKTAEAEAYRNASSAIGETAILENLQAQRAEYDKITAAGTKLTKQQQKDLDDLDKKIAEQTSKQVQAYKEVQDSIVEAFAKGIEENQKLADIAINTAGEIKSAFEGIASAGTSGIQAGLGVVSTLSSGIQADIDRAAERQLEAVSKAGLEGVELETARAAIQAQADAEKRQVLEQELRVRSRMADIEYEIESIRLEVATRTQIIEAKIAQQRLAAEAAIAKARGQDDLAKALSNAAKLQNQVIRGIQIEAGLQKEILGFRRSQEKAAIAAEAAGSNISGFAVPGIDQAIGKLQGFANYARGAAAEFGDLAIETAEFGSELDSKSVENGVAEADKVKAAISDAAASAADLSDLFGASAAAMSQMAADSVDLLRNIQSMNAFSLNARAMGGPVSAGSQYTINDGGGREAFMNKFGRLSMLPAGRNLQWTAPTSGMVIPAHLVSDYLSNAKAKQISSMTTRNQFNNGVSGNLITHASTSSSRSFANASSRIVNNVTIQSQNPVADASMLMIQAQKIKSRRRR